MLQRSRHDIDEPFKLQRPAKFAEPGVPWDQGGGELHWWGGDLFGSDDRGKQRRFDWVVCWLLREIIHGILSGPGISVSLGRGVI